MERERKRGDCWGLRRPDLIQPQYGKPSASGRAARYIFPQRDQELSRERHDRRFLETSAVVSDPFYRAHSRFAALACEQRLAIDPVGLRPPTPT